MRDAGITAEIQSRAKHIYSIHRKMERKHVAAEQIYDALALRVLVDNIAQCYLALGVVHTLWQPVAGEFDDYMPQEEEQPVPKPAHHRAGPWQSAARGADSHP